MLREKLLLKAAFFFFNLYSIKKSIQPQKKAIQPKYKDI